MSLPDLNHTTSLQNRLAPEARTFAVGNWTAELVGDELANITYAGRPVLRAIKGVIRDHQWRTLQPAVRDVAFLEDDDGVTVRFHVDYAGGEARYESMLKVRLTPLTVDVEFNGRAKTAFRRNRIGLVVLHPASESGREVTAVTPAGNVTTRRFPEDISPELIFTDIASLEWADAGTAFDLSFAGDVFETEDQRNWTDASFKTYSTPSADPIPVDVEEGDVVRQSVSLEAASIESPDVTAVSLEPALSVFSVGPAAGTVPPLGVSVDPTGTQGEVAAAHTEPVPALKGLDAVVVELYGPPEVRAARLQAAATEAAVHGAALDVRIVAEDLEGLPELFAEAEKLRPVRRLGIFSPATHCTDPALLPDFKRTLEATGFSGEILAGTRSHFTELNKRAKDAAAFRDADALTYSPTPQAHSTEIAHIVETIPIQRLTALNALRIGGGKPVHVGPITLKPRLHAPGQTPDSDELQDHVFTAAWTLASISSLTLEGVASITYFEAGPPRGIRTDDGRLTPSGELLRQLAGLKGEALHSVGTDSPEDSPVTLYPVSGPAGLRLFAGNLGPRIETVQVSFADGAPGRSGTAASARLTVIGEATGSGERIEPDHDGVLTFELAPWSTAVVEFP
ncbi:hypothetical protein [Arthrobacter sp. R4-81]